MAKHKAEVIYVHLPSVTEADYLSVIDKLVAAARLDGHKVALIMDYHVTHPYHAPPPHLDIHPNGDQTMTKDKERRKEGYGYAPFAWTEGWNKAREYIGALIRRYEPDYIQQGEASDIRNGWTITADKPHWFYNDTMSIFEQAADDTGWGGIFVVEAWKTSLIAARKKFGANRVIWVDELEDVIVGPTKPPEDDCEDELVSCEESLEVQHKLFLQSDEAREQLANDLWLCQNENLALRKALEECNEDGCEPCPECEDCDEKYQGLEDSLADLLDILWAFIGGRS